MTLHNVVIGLGSVLGLLALTVGGKLLGRFVSSFTTHVATGRVILLVDFYHVLRSPLFWIAAVALFAASAYFSGVNSH